MNLNSIKIDTFIINHYIGDYIIIYPLVNSFQQTYFKKNNNAVIENNDERVV